MPTDSKLTDHLGSSVFEKHEVYPDFPHASPEDRKWYDVSGSLDSFSQSIKDACDDYAALESYAHTLPWCKLNVGMRRPFWKLIVDKLHDTLIDEYSETIAPSDDTETQPVVTQPHISCSFEVLSPSQLHQRLYTRSADLAFRYEDLNEHEGLINDWPNAGTIRRAKEHRSYESMALWEETLYLVTTNVKVHQNPEAVSNHGLYVHVDRGIQSKIEKAYADQPGIVRPQMSVHSGSLALELLDECRSTLATACIVSNADDNAIKAIADGSLHIVPDSTPIKRTAYLIYRRFDGHPHWQHASKKKGTSVPYFELHENLDGNASPRYLLYGDQREYPSHSRWITHKSIYRKSRQEMEELLAAHYKSTKNKSAKTSPPLYKTDARNPPARVLSQCLIANTVLTVNALASERQCVIDNNENSIAENKPKLTTSTPPLSVQTHPDFSMYGKIQNEMIFVRNYLRRLDGHDVALIPDLTRNRGELDFVRRSHKDISRAWYNSSKDLKLMGYKYADCADQIISLTRRYEEIEREATQDRWGIIRVGFRRPLWGLILKRICMEGRTLGRPDLTLNDIRVGWRFETLSPFTIKERMYTRSIDLAFRYGNLTENEKLIHDEPGQYNSETKRYDQQTYRSITLWPEFLYLLTNDPEKLGSLSLINENRGFIHIDRGVNTEISRIYRDQFNILDPNVCIHHASFAFDKMNKSSGACFLSNASRRAFNAMSNGSLHRVLAGDGPAQPLHREACLIYKSPHHIQHIEAIELSCGETRFVLKGEKNGSDNPDERWKRYIQMICMGRSELIHHLDESYAANETVDGVLMKPALKFVERSLIANIAMIASTIAKEVEEDLSINDAVFSDSDRQHGCAET